MSAVDVRGGICGGTDKTGLCGLPLFWGRCEHHGLRLAVDPMREPVIKAPTLARGPFSAPVVHPAGWVDGRTKAGRALRAQGAKA